jgi:hypothetical protein
MTVKHVEQFHGKTPDQLSALSTEHLLEILESSRRRKTTEECTRGGHCYCAATKPLSPDEHAWNLQQAKLTKAIKQVLESRPHHAGTPKQAPKHEKKAMRY